MSHEHPIRDVDKRFIIDVNTRVVTIPDKTKPVLTQYDHNSEFITFEIERYVEGHDLLNCDKVEVHYNNIAAGSKQTSRGVYEADDFQIDTIDRSKAVFTWKISEMATQYAGTLHFIVAFSCTDEGDLNYRWNTLINSELTVQNGINNGRAVAENYADVLEMWKQDLFGISADEVMTIASMSQAQQDRIEEKGRAILNNIPEEYSELDAMVKAHDDGKRVVGCAENLRNKFNYEVIAETTFFDAVRTEGGYRVITSDFVVGNTYLVLVHGSDVSITHNTYLCGLLDNGSWEKMVSKTKYDDYQYAVVVPTENTDSICAMFSASDGTDVNAYVTYSIIDITNSDKGIIDIANEYIHPASLNVNDILARFQTINSVWANKKVLVIGDSLTAAGVWQKELSNLLGMTVSTHAYGGMGIIQCVDGSDDGTSLMPLKIADVHDKDLIIFFAGYNNRGMADGAVGDCYNSVDGTDKTIAGYLQYAINKIYEKLLGGKEDDVDYDANLSCRVAIVTPHCAGKYSYIDADGYDEYPSGSGRSMKTLAQTMEDVANHNSLPCYNAWKNSGINKFTWNEYASSSTPNSGKTEQGSGGPYYWNADQLHLNKEKGYPYLGQRIAEFVGTI